LPGGSASEGAQNDGRKTSFVRLATISEAAVDRTVVHIGRHHDTEMSESLFEALFIPSPEVKPGGRVRQLWRPLRRGGWGPVLPWTRPGCVYPVAHRRFRSINVRCRRNTTGVLNVQANHVILRIPALPLRAVVDRLSSKRTMQALKNRLTCPVPCRGGDGSRLLQAKQMVRPGGRAGGQTVPSAA
jgi:hypothetical protein